MSRLGRIRSPPTPRIIPPRPAGHNALTSHFDSVPVLSAAPPQYPPVTDLTPDQAVTVRDAVRRRTAYPHAVQVRVYRRGVGPGDRLYNLFNAAELAMRTIAEELHSLSLNCERRPLEPGRAGAY
jgi:hypothetical protein